jgi:hypothetical protein
MATVLKTVIGASLSRVQIPAPPPISPIRSAGAETGRFEEDAAIGCGYTSTITPRRVPLSLGPEVSRSEGPTWRLRRRTEKFVGVCVIVSGSAHGLVTQEHFQEWWGYGVFFLATAICLIGFGLALITDAIDPRYMPGDVNVLRRLMYAAGAIGNVSILGLYLLTRTAGIPLGPGSGVVESVGAIDIVAKTTELLAVAGLVALLVKTRPGLVDG